VPGFSRRARADHTRARLEALTPRWVPTVEAAEAELHGNAPPPVGAAPLAASALAPDRRGLIALGLVGAGAVLGGGLVWWLALPAGTAVPQVAVLPAASPVAGLPSATVPAPTLATDEPTVGATPAAVVMVDVKGRVRRPGVVELPAGSRVVDALAAAGGLTARGSTDGLNLAAVLTDGVAIVVTGAHGVVAAPALPGSAPTSSDPAAAAPIDLNAATLEQLDTLPGIGPVLAERILQWRTEHGRFGSVAELKEVSGIGDATFADLEPLVRT